MGRLCRLLQGLVWGPSCGALLSCPAADPQVRVVTCMSAPRPSPERQGQVGGPPHKSETCWMVGQAALVCLAASLATKATCTGRTQSTKVARLATVTWRSLRMRSAPWGGAEAEGER